MSDKPFFTVRRNMIVKLASSHKMPTIYAWPDYVAEGGLVSYGNSLVDAYYLMANATGKILSGAKPSDIPVQQPTTFYLAVNLTTAKTLGIAIPGNLLAIADKVVE